MIKAQDIINIIFDLLEETDKDNFELKNNSAIINGHPAIDSLILVQLAIALEEIAEGKGFDFDWRSEKAMSSLNSVFKTPDSIAEEFNRQELDQNKI